jgi:hypothetical protein
MENSNNNNLLQIVIPLLDTDLPIFQRGYPYILKNLPCKEIILIGNEKLRFAVQGMEKVRFVNENEIVPGLTFDSVKKVKETLSGNSRRTGWYFQQFLKMGYAKVCNDEYYLVWDSDTIPLNQISFFDEDRPYLAYRSFVSEDKCYDDAQAKLLPDEILTKKQHLSFIAEHMLFKVSYMRDFIDAIEVNSENEGSSFFEKIMHCVPRKLINLSGFSEFEAYAAYVQVFHKDFYKLRAWNNCRDAAAYVGKRPTNADLSWIGQLFDTASIENFYRERFICKLINSIDKGHKIPFNRIYHLIHPLVDVEMRLRLVVRSIIKK